jgi:hypothetical protein
MRICVATTSTSHYDWHGIGRTRDEAKDALLRAWYVHCAAIGADPAYLDRESINVIEGTFGTGFHDFAPVTAEVGAYIEAARAAIEREDARVGKYLTPTCSECGQWAVEGDGAHVVVGGFVVVGCEGYWPIDPNIFGLDHPEWTSAKGESR